MKTYIISILSSGFGHKKITIEYRGKEYSGITNDMPTVDAYNSDTFTRKQEADKKRAGKQLIRMVKNIHDLK